MLSVCIAYKGKFECIYNVTFLWMSQWMVHKLRTIKGSWKSWYLVQDISQFCHAHETPELGENDGYADALQQPATIELHCSSTRLRRVAFSFQRSTIFFFHAPCWLIKVCIICDIPLQEWSGSNKKTEKEKIMKVCIIFEINPALKICLQVWIAHLVSYLTTLML